MEVRLEHISKKYGSKYALRDFTATPEKRSVMKISKIRCPYMAIWRSGAGLDRFKNR